MRGEGEDTVLVMPMTACFEVVDAIDLAIDICEFNDRQFMIAPR